MRADPCPLCRAEETDAVVLSVPYERIWTWLEEQWGARYPPETRERLTPADEATLYRCGCGLERFSPLNPGDEEFYSRLAESNVPRWEFPQAARRISGDERVVDFGCGTGNFLRTLDVARARAVGVDHSHAALALVGGETSSLGFREFAEREAGQFDVACGFQVIEHLPDVGDLIEPMKRAVRPGGRLFVSMPNRERLGRRDDEPFDFPPHHLSRWSLEQIPTLADRFGLHVVSVDVEPPDRSVLVDHRIAPGRALPRRALRVTYRSTVMSERLHARRSGAYARRRLYGHSILVEMRCGARTSDVT